jgi:hypothetical protein
MTETVVYISDFFKPLMNAPAHESAFDSRLFVSLTIYI